ncbi:MAG: hypothetical protein Q4D07_03085 [Selenomonadaceae bacterium]|nr:hypothetical protein [Selenomonadaceae bacterium]
MASRCINCGGELKYDIPSGKVKCLHCDSSFEPETFKTETAAEEYKGEQNSTPKYDATMFVCPNCGAEIYSTELDAVNYCLYCGSFVTLESQLGRVRKPDYIIPFTKTAEDCKAAYKKMIRRQIYAPGEFRDENFIQGFKGIYIPFWNFGYKYGPEIEIKGETETREGDYLIKQKYNTKCKASGTVDSVAYDASSNFDDEISLRIAPYKREDMKTFNPCYMFGFFGDTADIDREVYRKQSNDEIKEELWKAISESKGVSDAHPTEEVPETMEKDFRMKKKISLAMLPVWFLTWRKGDRVAYSVMNGSNGNMYAEIPVSVTRYILFSLLTAVPIFFGLNEIVTFTANEILIAAMILAMVMCLLYVFELDKIVRRVMHTDDMGFLETHEEAKKESDEKVSKNAIMAILEALGANSLGGWLVVIFSVIVICIGAPEYAVVGLIIAVVGTPIYTLYRLYDNAKILKEKGSSNVWLDIAGALFSVVLGAGLLIYDPAPDIDYYIAAVVCMLGIGVAAVRMVSRYNQFITRPVPRFFDRKEGAE